MQPTEIVDTLPEVVRFMMKSGNLILAGGYIRDLFLGERPKDIDLFGNIDKIVELTSILHQSPWSGSLKWIRASDDKYVHTAFFRDIPFPVQMVAAPIETLTPESLLERFDFTINQVAMNLSDEKLTMSPRFTQDLISRNLVFNDHSSPIRGFGPTLLRVLKFVRKGFVIDSHSLARIIANLTQTDYDAILLMLSNGKSYLD